MTEFITACDCGGENEIEGAENVDFGISPTLNDEVDRQAHLRELIPQWLDQIEWRDSSDVREWEREGYRATDIIRRLKLENERSEPIDGHPWPDATRDPRNHDPYPVSLSNSAVRTYHSDEGEFEWNLSVTE